MLIKYPVENFMEFQDIQIGQVFQFKSNDYYYIKVEESFNTLSRFNAAALADGKLVYFGPYESVKHCANAIVFPEGAL